MTSLTKNLYANRISVTSDATQNTAALCDGVTSYTRANIPWKPSLWRHRQTKHFSNNVCPVDMETQVVTSLTNQSLS